MFRPALAVFSPRGPLPAISMLTLLTVLLSSPSLASVHLMQIHQVIGGVDGDTSAQAVQLRMRSSFQNQTQGARLVVRDATGSNPIVISDPASSVPNQGTGVAVLFATPAFLATTDPAAVPDFVMNPIPASYLTAGSLTFEADLGTIYWRLSWGGSAYTGGTRGSTFNDLDGVFSPNYPGPLPSAGTAALIFQGAATAMSTNNAADYALGSGDAVFTNNAGQSFALSSATPAPAALTRVQAILYPAFPNPFNPRTTLRFELRAPATVSLRVLSIDGRLVRVLHEGQLPAGTVERVWNGQDWRGQAVASGVYRVQLRSPEETAQQWVTLVK